MVTRRLDADERQALKSGCIYAWEERGPHSEITGLGIERFTEGRRWSPSRVRDVSGRTTIRAPLSAYLHVSRSFCFITRNTHPHQRQGLYIACSQMRRELDI
jgi:hypothetical protein